MDIRKVKKLIRLKNIEMDEHKLLHVKFGKKKILPIKLEKIDVSFGVSKIISPVILSLPLTLRPNTFASISFSN